MPRTNDPLHRLTIYCGAGIAGWSETHYINSDSRAQAIAHASTVCEARRIILPVKAKIQFARVSQLRDERDGNAVESGIGAGYFAESLVEGASGASPTAAEVKSRQTVDFPSTCAYFRLEGSTGGVSARLLRGLPDFAVQDLELWTTLSTALRSTPAPPVAAALARAGAVATYALALQAYLSILTQYTLQVSPKFDGQGFYNWQYTDRIIFRKVGSRKVGRPFNLYRGRA